MYCIAQVVKTCAIATLATGASICGIAILLCLAAILLLLSTNGGEDRTTLRTWKTPEVTLQMQKVLGGGATVGTFYELIANNSRKHERVVICRFASAVDHEPLTDIEVVEHGQRIEVSLDCRNSYLKRTPVTLGHTRVWLKVREDDH